METNQNEQQHDERPTYSIGFTNLSPEFEAAIRKYASENSKDIEVKDYDGVLGVICREKEHLNKVHKIYNEFLEKQ